jgi:hypothetical protein
MKRKRKACVWHNMQPNEYFRKQPNGGRTVINNLVDPQSTLNHEAIPQSVLARPHSRQQVVKSSRGLAAAAPGPNRSTNALFAATAPAGRMASPPRLKQDSSPMHASPPPPNRSRSPQQTVRTLGNAIVNPQTVFGLGVEQATHTHAVRSTSPNTGHRSIPGSPSRSGHPNSSSLHLSAIHVQPGGMSNLLSLRPQQHEVEVYGMEALKERYGTTTLDVAPTATSDGCKMEDLSPELVPAPNLKKLDLGIVVPHYGVDAFVKPCITRCGDADVAVELPHAVDAPVRVAAPVVVERFVALVVGVEETGLDRAISYMVTPDVPELFTAMPTIDPHSGDLHFTPNPLASGTSKCLVRALDHAMVDDDGNVATSDPLPFTITVIRVKSGTSTTLSGEATNTALSTAAHHNRVFLATQGDFAMTHSPQELLRMRREQEGTTGESSVRHEDDAPPEPFVFPEANPHELRYADVCQVNNLWIAQHPTNNNSGDDVQPTRLYRPCFDSPLSDWELIRMGKATQERDRIVGERVAEETRVELETKLVERIRVEEKRLGMDSPELCPLLLRLAQVYMSQNSKRQGDVVETLERICRIRLAALGIDSFDQIESLAMQLSGGLAGSVTWGQSTAQGHLNGSIIGSGGILNSSLFAAAHAVAMDGDHTATDDDGSAASATKESKKFEAFQQSMMLLTMYLKSVGRYRELLEFAHYSLTAATIVHGDSSVSYLRAMTETAEAHMLLGNYKEASSTLAGCIARSEVLFGAQSSATLGLVHMCGVCLSEEREYSKSIAQHDRALRSRLHEGTDHVAIAESQLLAAWCRMQSGSESTTMQERMIEHLECAIGTLTGLNVSTLSPALCVARAGLLTLAARMCRMRGDDERARQLLSSAADHTASVRGFDSIDYATAKAGPPSCLVQKQIAPSLRNSVRRLRCRRRLQTFSLQIQCSSMSWV